MPFSLYPEKQIEVKFLNYYRTLATAFVVPLKNSSFFKSHGNGTLRPHYMIRKNRGRDFVVIESIDKS